MQIFTSKSTKNIANQFILAVGGGSVIDRAKIYAKKHKKYLIAIPTTGAGATETTHAVKWNKKKTNIKTDKPLTVMPPFPIKLSNEARRNTCLDIIGHLVDVLNVCPNEEIVKIGIDVGKLIEKHPTNLTHPASYPITLKGMPHGEAVGRVLKESIDKAFPL